MSNFNNKFSSIKQRFGGTSLNSDFKQSFANLSSTPLANLRQSVARVQNYYTGKQGNYDRVALAFSSVQEQYAAAEENRLNADSDNTAFVSDEVEVSNESGAFFAGSLADAMIHSAVADNDGSGLVSIDTDVANHATGVQSIALSDADGITYSLYEDMDAYSRFQNGDRRDAIIVWSAGATRSYPVMWVKDGKVFMSPTLKSSTYCDPLNVFDDYPSISSRTIYYLIVTLWMIYDFDSYYSSARPWTPSRTSMQDLLITMYYYITGETLWDSDIVNVVDHLHNLIAVAPYNTGLNIRDKLLDCIASTISVRGKFRKNLKNFVSLSRDMVNTAEINQTLIDLCDVALNSKPADALRAMQTKAINGSRVFRAMVTAAADAFRVGGFRGLIKYIINYIRGGSTLKEKDGTLKYTNNGSYIPKEFIGGLIWSIISSIADLVLMVAALMKNIYGVIIGIIVKLVSGIFNTVKSTYDDTYASAYNDSDDEDLTVLPYSPTSFGRFIIKPGGESNTFRVLSDAYIEYQGLFEIPVPGGTLLCGPAEVDENGEVVSFACEFHPAAIIYTDEWINDKNGNPITNDLFIAIATGQVREGDDDIYDADYIASDGYFDIRTLHNHADSHFLNKLWARITSMSGLLFRPIVNGSNGHLSADDDIQLRHSLFVNVALFITYMASTEPLSGAVLSTNQAITLSSVTSQGTGPGSKEDFGYYVDILHRFNNFGYVVHSGDDTWNDFASAMVASTTVDSGGGSYASIVLMKQGATVLKTYKMPVGYGVAATGGYFSEVGQYTVFGSSSIPDVVRWELIFPSYNSKTYWTWVILAGSIITIAAIAVAVVSVKFSKFAKKKKAANVAKFNEAQSDYQEAINGRKSYIDENGNLKYEQFDPNSPEGAAYIKDCYKTYKKTAFTNNCWASIIGGTKYDITTFYGEAEEAESIDESSGTLDGFNETNLNGNGEVQVEDIDSPALVDTTTYQYVAANSNPLVTNNVVAHSIEELSDQVSELAQATDANVLLLANQIKSLSKEQFDALYLIITGHQTPTKDIDALGDL